MTATQRHRVELIAALAALNLACWLWSVPVAPWAIVAAVVVAVVAAERLANRRVARAFKDLSDWHDAHSGTVERTNNSRVDGKFE